MADLIFPPSPTTGEEFTGTFGEIYTWDGEKWSLTAGSGGGGGAPVVGDTPPASPTLGQLYWDLPTAKLFLWDGTQWVAVIVSPEGSGGGGGGGSQGPQGPAGPAGPTGPPGPTVVSTDANNSARLGSDNFIFVPNTWGYASLPAEVQRVPIGFPIAGQPPPSGTIFLPTPMALTIPASLAGTVGFQNTICTSNATFTINRVSGGTTTALGAVTFTTAGHTSINLSGAGGSLAVGDVIQILAPASQDATLADLAITILAMRV